jgi:hypothetical protein
MEHEGSLPYSQVPATCPYYEPDQTNTCPNPTSWRFILTLYSHLRLGFLSGSLSQVSPPKSCLHLSFPPYVLHAPLISFFLVWLPEQHLVSSTDQKALRYVVPSTTTPVTSSVLDPNILLNTLFSNTLSLYSSLSVRDQVSHPHKPKGKRILVF